MRTWLLGLVVLTGCATSDAAPKGKPAATVEMSAVNLADNCPKATPAKPAKARAGAPASEAPPSRAPGAVARRRACEQTTMQLMLTSTGSKAQKVAVTKVELLDDKGKVLQTLKAREPQAYETDHYVAWDQQLAAGATVSVMYALSAPDWDTLTQGRGNAHDRSFQVRATLTIGSGRTKVSKTAIVPARLPPALPT